jgi:hypothetical protein
MSRSVPKAFSTWYPGSEEAYSREWPYTSLHISNMPGAKYTRREEHFVPRKSSFMQHLTQGTAGQFLALWVCSITIFLSTAARIYGHGSSPIHI